MSASIQRAIAGAVVYDAESTIPAILAKGLKPEAWTDASPRIVMEAALRMYLARSPIDALTIQATIERDGTPQIETVAPNHPNGATGIHHKVADL